MSATILTAKKSILEWHVYSMACTCPQHGMHMSPAWHAHVHSMACTCPQHGMHMSTACTCPQHGMHMSTAWHAHAHVQHGMLWHACHAVDMCMPCWGHVHTMLWTCPQHGMHMSTAWHAHVHSMACTCPQHGMHMSTAWHAHVNSMAWLPQTEIKARKRPFMAVAIINLFPFCFHFAHLPPPFPPPCPVRLEVNLLLWLFYNDTAVYWACASKKSFL